MNVVYYTSGLTGTGRLVMGLSVGNALKRNKIDCQYTILSGSQFGHLADALGIAHREIPLEDENYLRIDNFQYSELYGAISELKPDLLLVDLLWFPLYHFIDDLFCKKIFLSRQVDNAFFAVPDGKSLLQFDPGQYDRVFAIEPFTSKIPMERINPLVLRNRDEIHPRDEALSALGLNESDRNCLIAYNGHPGDFDRVYGEYSSLEDQGFRLVSSTNYAGGIFPVVDYFNAFDLIVCGAGYNAFWEARYFKKEAIFIPTDAMFVSGEKRIRECKDFHFSGNGADQLASIISEIIS